MKDNKFKITPDMLPKVGDYIDLENVQYPTEGQQKELEKNPHYQGYVKKYKDQAKKYKKKKIIDMFFDRGLVIFNTVLALIAAVTGILSILLQLNLI